MERRATERREVRREPRPQAAVRVDEPLRGPGGRRSYSISALTIAKSASAILIAFDIALASAAGLGRGLPT